ncbi:MAG TPA: hypothetical protein VF263_13135 [Longimicrobiaceae bacterium]
MTDPNLDDAERLAALFDSRLDGRAREEVLARLAVSDETLEVYAEAAAVAREMEEEDAPAADVVPLRAPARRPGWLHGRGRWTALAAMLAAVALVPLLWTRVRSPEMEGPERAVALLASSDAGLPTRWEQRPWSRTRSGADPLTPETRAVRLGAHLADLRVLVRARDTAAAEVAGRIEALLADVSGSGRTMEIYQDVGRRAGEPPAALEPLVERGEAGVARLFGATGHVALGTWVETARLAAARRDAAFFRRRATRDALDGVADLPTLPASARAPLDRARAEVRREGAPDWGALERDLTEVLREAGS